MTQPDQMRRNVFDLLATLSGAEAQRDYERDVPIASVPWELNCMWFDDIYHPDDAEFQRAFSAEELVELARFHAIYEAETVEMQPVPEAVADLQARPAWERVMRAASVALRAISSAEAKSTNTGKGSRAAGIAKRVATMALIWGGLFAISYFTNLQDPTPPSRVFHYILGYFVFGWIDDTLPYDTSPTFAKLMMAAFVFELAAAIGYATTGKRRHFLTFLGVFIVRIGISFILFVFENAHT